jgi:hypothetical protein
MSWSGKWTDEALGTNWETEIRQSNETTLVSVSQNVPDRGIFLARGCVLTVPGKFFAETLLVYPSTVGNFPIFGSEYIKMARGHFGATDFHPLTPENNQIPADFNVFPDRIVEKSPHYDLNTHFSPKLWHRKGVDDFYEEFSEVCEGRLYHYLEVLSTVDKENPVDTTKFTPFDSYMAVNDPARGILKAYFGESFANDYIKSFLFPHCGPGSQLG